jgi:hypothetical protein
MQSRGDADVETQGELTGFRVRQGNLQTLFDTSGNQTAQDTARTQQSFWEQLGDSLGDLAKVGLVGAGMYYGLPALASAFGGGAAAAGAGAAGELGLAGTTSAMSGGFGAGAAGAGTAATGAALGTYGANALGSGAFDAGLGNILSTTAAPTIGQGAVLAPAATAATGAMGAGLGGAATDFAGNMMGAGTAAGSNALSGMGDRVANYLTSPSGIQTAASLLGGAASAYGANSAANTQSDAANRALALQREIYDSQKALQEPYRAAGLTAQNRMLDYLGLSANAGQADYGKYARDFGMSDFQQDPGYAFRLAEGEKALKRRQSVGGNLFSSQALRNAQEYGQGMASQEFNNAYNRYQTNRANQLQPLGNLMSSGQSAASNVGSAAGQYGTAGGNLIQSGGQATAAGQMGVGNTINNAIGAGISAYQNNNLLDMLRRQNASSYQNPYANA